MQRIVFEKIPMEGFRTSKVESIAVCKNGHRLYAGTSDGALIAYDCQTSLSCKSIDVIDVYFYIPVKRGCSPSILSLSLASCYSSSLDDHN